jgi:DNA-binding transcriptional ArsR family regulator
MPRKRKPKPATPEDVLLFLLQHPLRKRLLQLYIEEGGMLSPKELTGLTKQHLSNVSYHVRTLVEHGALRLAETKPRRGAVEHFYKATSLVDDVPWGRVALGLGGEAT